MYTCDLAQESPEEEFRAEFPDSLCYPSEVTSQALSNRVYSTGGAVWLRSAYDASPRHSEHHKRADSNRTQTRVLISPVVGNLSIRVPLTLQTIITPLIRLWTECDSTPSTPYKSQVTTDHSQKNASPKRTHRRTLSGSPMHARPQIYRYVAVQSQI